MKNGNGVMWKENCLSFFSFFFWKYPWTDCIQNLFPNARYYVS